MNEEIIDQNFVEEEDAGIDWLALAKKLWTKKKYFFISLPIAAVIAIVIALSIPAYYNVEVKLAPEMSTGNRNPTGGLSSLMKSMGIGALSTQNGGDAILPNLYPDLMNSKAFLVSLFDVQVDNKNKKKPISTNYYDYLENYQKIPWWSQAIGGVFEAVEDILPKNEEDEEYDDSAPANASALTKKQAAIVKSIEKKIVCDVDEKTFVITIDVTDQDPVICAEMADSTCRRLQDFITEYRTKKALQEMENVQIQYDKAKIEYEESKAAVAEYNDANWDLVEQDFILEKQALQNEMQLKYSAYSAFASQLITARAKVEEMRPVYTVLDGASVPLKKAGPKRGRIVGGIIFLVFALQAAWILREDIKGMIFSSKKKDDDDEN
ncbi:MAG: chain-length determining protein [Prevotellaceae bacterium]|nr:chain-length determining protein [Candidatus Minthosoma equi]